MYTGIIHSMYTIQPAKSHVLNVGFLEESTHTKDAPAWVSQNVQPVEFPIRYREKVEWDRDFDICYMTYAGEHGLTIKIKHLLGLDINKSIWEVFKRKKSR